MTKREVYSEIVARYEGATEGFEAALYELATKELHSLDVTAARNSAKRAEKLAADAPLVEAVKEVLNTAQIPITTSEIAATVGVSTSKASYILRSLVDEGVAVASDVKVKGKGSAKAYALA